MPFIFIILLSAECPVSRLFIFIIIFFFSTSIPVSHLHHRHWKTCTLFHYTDCHNNPNNDHHRVFLLLAIRSASWGYATPPTNRYYSRYTYYYHFPPNNPSGNDLSEHGRTIGHTAVYWSEGFPSNLLQVLQHYLLPPYSHSLRNQPYLYWSGCRLFGYSRKTTEWSGIECGERSDFWSSNNTGYFVTSQSDCDSSPKHSSCHQHHHFNCHSWFSRSVLPILLLCLQAKSNRCH